MRMEHGEPHHHPNLVFTLADVEAIREKVARYDWARNLYRRIKTAVDGGTEAYYPPGRRFSMANPDPGMAAFPDEGPGRRAVLETPAFRIDFRGAYVYLRMVEGKVAAVQGKVEEAVAVA